jgi:hypothetical protein
MDETDKTAPPPPTEVGKSPGYIPRPPSKEDVERISEQQGMVSDEWAPQPPPAAPPAKPGG